MAGDHIHAVVVSGIEPTPNGGEHLTWGLITALDLVPPRSLRRRRTRRGRAREHRDRHRRHRRIAQRAAQLMVEHQLSHLLVVKDGLPVGVLSTLDIAGCMAWGEV